MKFRVAAALATLALVGCEAASDVPVTEPHPFSLAETAGSEPPSAATIAMRWQWLNPEVNSFTFRNTHEVFAFREVDAPESTGELARRSALSMPAGAFAGENVTYDEWAERTFTNAFIVLRDGEIVFEDYRNRMTADTPHIAFSMSKTITAMLIGQALERGEIASLDDPVSSYVPALAEGGYGEATIHNLLEMRSGAAIEERYDFGDNPSLAGLIHQQAIVENVRRFAEFGVGIDSREAPGGEFNYATLDTAVLGWVLEEATGERIEDLTETRLWQPMGAEFDAHWLADGPVGTGRALNGMGFNAALRDFARLGQLMLDDGMVGETRVLPEGWLAQMTTMRPLDPESPRPGYGLQTWQFGDEEGAYAAVGLAGQYIYVHPASRTVVVKLSYYPPGAELDGEVADYFETIARTSTETTP
ncbi:serine hydrolase [Aurantiacibacter sp. MUD11]|uniref:serine hydrolase domain-containing protein n=1 Tax=Aurantiacibacter sp. MUD11 TaxID=3003265 RepID=UPI0022AA3B2A|nr:serine hydrolase [Aurantiacibacter sp. MUD11]WAT17436.1 serine hydrolase [Aurantiacibacter sp. MUD11]